MNDGFEASEWLVDRHVRQGHGETLAIRTRGRSVSYGELADQVAGVAGMFAGLGVAPGDRVLLVLLDGVEFVAAFLGALRVGAVPVPVNPLLPAKDLAGVAEDAGAGVIVVSGQRAPAVADLVAGAAGVVTVVVTEPVGERAIASAKMVWWPEMLGAAPRLGVRESGEDGGFWLCSSGTTGQPKLVMHRQVDLWHVWQTFASSVLKVSSDDRLYSVAPMFHAYGLGNSLVFPLAAGATAVLEPARPPTPTLVSDILRDERPTIFFSVPTNYAALAQALPPDAFASVRLAVSAGEALPGELFTRYRDEFGIEVIDGIGSTEMGHIFISNRPGSAVAGASGFVVPGHEVMLRDGDGTEVKAGAPGYLWVKGPAAASGYWNRADAAAQTFVDGWVRTGDVYQCSDTGLYRYLGRADDLFKVAGEWVSPFEVESALMELDGVQEVAVVPGLFHGLLQPVAFVVPAPDARMNEAKLLQQCRPLLAGFKRPRSIRVVDALPKTAVGKLQRAVLRQRLAVELRDGD